MANIASVVNELEKLSISLKTKADGIKATDVPKDANSKLEAIITQLQGVQGDIGGQQKEYVQAYEALVDEHVKHFLNLSNDISEEVKKIATLFKNVFDAQRAFIILASESKPPSQEVLSKLLQPTSQAIATLQNFRDDSRGSQWFNHLSSVSDSTPALGWVAVTPKPAPFVNEMADAGRFYCNRVIKDFKVKDVKHVDWTKALMKIFTELQAYVVKYHITGIVWNKQGKDAAPSPAGSAAPPPPPAGGPPPPPPPTGDFTPSATSGNDQASAHGALFAQINKGQSVTGGLKKVTPSMQTHKNPTLRQGPKPFGAPTPFKATSVSKPVTAAAAPVKKPPLTELKNKRWNVQYHENNSNIAINDTNMKQTVYILKCVNSTIQIKGKVNSITLDGCKKVGIVFESVVSSVDVINSQSVKIQVTDNVPIVNIDKSDGAMLYLCATSLATQLVSAKSSEMNILVPDKDGEFKEYAVPEQFRTVWTGTNLKTDCSEVVG